MTRTCTCHPDDNPPIPCAKQYAYSECQRYAKTGRPEKMTAGKRHNVYLDAESWAIAVKVGNGNASAGIRDALAKLREGK